MVPPTYNANLQILQSSDVVLIRHEMMHDARMIYLDGRPHPPPSLQWLAGHSVGRFEGQTLVVDTTNFTALTNFRGSPGNSRQDIFASERLHVVERFTRTGEDTIRYSFTVDDPIPGCRRGRAKWKAAASTGRSTSTHATRAISGLANILRAARVAEHPSDR